MTAKVFRFQNRCKIPFVISHARHLSHQILRMSSGLPVRFDLLQTPSLGFGDEKPRAQPRANSD
jgi:hypothetical protein